METQNTTKMVFNPGFNILPKVNPMGFEYGPDTFGPEVENRLLKDIRKSLKDPQCDGPEVVYSIAMDVGKNEHKLILEELHLLFGVVTYASGQLGNEPVRSQGHIHSKSVFANNWSTPEVYEIWQGKAIIYMQERATDDPGRCFAIRANPGDIVIVPPFWAHSTISADPKIPLTFGAWCDREYGFDYDEVREHKGLAWFPVYENEKLSWKANNTYNKSVLIEKEPESYSSLGIVKGKSIYKTFEDNPGIFGFVSKPYLIEQYWKSFTP